MVSDRSVGVAVGPGIYNMEIVFFDIEKYSLNTSDDQQTIIEDFSNSINKLLTDFCERQEINNSQVLKLPTGDGAAIVFLDLKNPGTSMSFAQRFLIERKNYQTRVGVHFNKGIVYKDINGQLNVAGEAINLTQRIMSIADGKQILLSENMHNLLINFKKNKQSYFELHKEVEVKHGLLINIYQYLPQTPIEKARISGSAPTKIIEPTQLFTRKLHKSLSQINNSFKLESLSKNWLTGGSVNDETKTAIRKASTIIRIVCYSFKVWSDQYRVELKNFLKSDSQAKLQILLLEPRSVGFLEKTSFESFSKGNDIPKWTEETEDTRITHLDELKASIMRIKKLQRDVEEINTNILCSMYTQTPIVTGIIVDDQQMIVSSYYVNPLKRGVELPCLKLEKNTLDDDLLPLFDLILNWYNVNFSIGLESQYLQKEFANQNRFD